MARKKKQKQDDMRHRSFSLRLDAGNRPSSLDEETRTVDVVAATEAPCSVIDWDTWTTWPEVLPVGRATMPVKTPLLDAHNRWSTGDIIGSGVNWRVEDEQILATAKFSQVEKADTAFQLLREGHLTDVSIGYRVKKYLRIQEGEEGEVDGKTYTGPVLVALDWEIKELSFCPIGADADAKARALDGHNKQEESDMEWLERMAKLLGLSEDASEDQIRKAVEEEITKRMDAGDDYADLIDPAEEGQNGGVLDVRGDVRGVVRDELARQRKADQDRAREITEMCKRHAMADLAGDMIARGLSVAHAQTEVLEAIAKRTGDQDMPGFGHITMGATSGEKLRAAASDGLLMRAGITVESPAVGADEFMGVRLDALARECLRAAGQKVGGDVMEMIGRALTTSDLPVILTEAANRSVLVGFQEQPETWEEWCATGQVSDFKTNKLISVGLFGDLDEVGEDGEIDAAYLEAASEAIKLATYAKRFPISRQAIINDDLGVLTDVPKAMGAAAARTVGNLPYAVLTANAALSDGVALFHSTHGNLAASGADISVAALQAGENAMTVQKDVGGEAELGILARFFLSGTKNRATREQFFGTEEIGGATNQPNLKNPYAGTYLTRVYDHRLNDTKVKWYLAAGKGMTVKVVFLNGVRTPRVESRNGWSREGIEYKVGIDAAAGAVSYRGLYSNPGV
ncbi:MAG: prohead protease/major capsid protein fusion protein [Pseudodesulfovibrio sp.]|uniref:prohead protease/major capsid protein fusion protein n=1 Tax=Pseudodesulfovibrio sp. TaxID=2035812 RepID=UPI003D10C15B